MSNYLKPIVFVSGFISVIVGLVVIFGWIFDLPVLKSLNPEFISMKANTAVCFIFFGIAILILNGNNKQKVALNIAQGLLSFIIILSVITFIQYPFKLNLGIDQLLFNEESGTAGTLYPGRMAGSTIVCFILLGVSLLLTDSKFKQCDITSQILALVSGLISILPQLGYAYSESDLFTFAYQTPMALNTSITLLTASIGAFFMRPAKGFLKIIDSDTLGGTFAKRLFPILILIPVLFIWVRLAIHAGGYDLQTIDLEIISILYIIIFIITFWRVFTSLNEVDEKRRLIALMRNKAEDDLKNSEKKYRKIFENIQDVFFHTDISDTIIEISPSIFRVAGYRREELIGKKASEVYFNVEARGQLEEIMSKNGEVWDYEILLRTKNGKIKVTSLNAHLHFDANGNLIGTEGLLRDIDDRKQFEIQLQKSKEKAEESDRLKTAFLQNISHEIRTPMNAIMGFSSLLGLPGNTSKTEATYIETIQSSSKQLLSIINDIVDVSTIEANTIKINISTFNLNETLKSLYNQYTLRSAVHNVSLKLTTGLSDDQSLIRTDNSRLIQIISNLINNAFKFSKKGIIEFGYKLKGSMIEFHVTDNGIGIHPEYHSKIFNSFYQVESEISMQYGGTGLGLSICKAYVELLGGEIWLTSKPGEGSVFYFSIPYEPATLKPHSETKSADMPIENIPDKLNILVAEDDDMNFRLIKFFLKDMNIKIIRAVNGIEAIEKSKTENRIALVLMDIKMPLMDGYIAAKAIKEQFPDVAIIAQTAYFNDREKAIRSGCSDFISKPFNKEQLIQKISQYLPKK